MTEGSLHRHHVTPGCYQAARVEVPEIVQPEALEASALAGHPPPVMHGVRQGRVIVLTGEHPAAGVVVVRVRRRHVLREHRDERRGQEDDALLPYLGARISKQPCARCTCRETLNVRRIKSMSPSWTPAASPRRRPAKAQRPTKALKAVSEASRSSLTSTVDGRVMAASRRRRRGSVTPALGSTGMIRSATAPPEDGPDVVGPRGDSRGGEVPRGHRLDPALDVGAP